ncbi:MAG: RyR domain-containing protein [Bacteroidales bacterium]|jgi:hypothetical protein|nr:RyR domain-containing protein [Bacteroidales bacterium]
MKFRDLEWWLVGTMGVVAFVLAFSGFNIIFIEAGTDRTLPDLIYDSIKIFGMDIIDDYTSPLPWQLETARWLAPGVLIYTAIKAILYLLRREIKSSFVAYYRDHVIVTGLSDNSRHLVSDLLAHGVKVIVIGAIPHAWKLDPVEKEGAIIIEGDLTIKSFLRYIGASKAKFFVFVEENDEKNVADAIAVHNFLAVSGKGRHQMLYTHISDDLKLDEIRGLHLLENQIGTNKAGTDCEIRIFSACERATRIIFNKYSPDRFTKVTSPADPQVRVAVIGSGSLAQSMVIRFARLGHFANLEKMQISLFQEEPSMASRLERSFRQLRNFVDIELIDQPHDLFDAEEFEQMNSAARFSAVYLLCENDAAAASILNKLSKIDIGVKMNVILALNDPDGMLGRWVTEKNFENITLHKFNVTGETFTKQGLILEELDRLAVVIHEDYLSKKESIDPDRASHRPWRKLPVDFRNQNRDQADHLGVKLRAIGYDLEADPSSVVISPEKAELLARMEHNRWWAHMALSGWTLSEKKDDLKKKHTDLIPYEQLSEGTKDYDRNAVKNIPLLLGKYRSAVQ